MGKMKSSLKVSREVVQFARQNRLYWLIPLIGVLALTGLLIVAGQAAAPLLYTLF